MSVRSCCGWWARRRFGSWLASFRGCVPSGWRRGASCVASRWCVRSASGGGRRGLGVWVVCGWRVGPWVCRARPGRRGGGVCWSWVWSRVLAVAAGTRHRRSRGRPTARLGVGHARAACRPAAADVCVRSRCRARPGSQTAPRRRRRSGGNGFPSGRAASGRSCRPLFRVRQRPVNDRSWPVR